MKSLTGGVAAEGKAGPKLVDIVIAEGKQKCLTSSRRSA